MSFAHDERARRNNQAMLPRQLALTSVS